MEFSEIFVKTFVSHPFEENIYLVRRRDSNDCLIVDPGFLPDEFIETIEKENLKPTAILVTHGHYDHIAGINEIREVWRDCKIYVGEHEKEKLTDPDQNLSSAFGFPMSVSPADILLSDGMKIEIAGIPIEVLHLPGHSSGHVVYLIRTEPKSILFAGDVLFHRSIGRSDFPDGNHADLIGSICSKLFTLPDDTLVYCGHGPTTTIGEERRENPFIV